MEKPKPFPLQIIAPVHVIVAITSVLWDFTTEQICGRDRTPEELVDARHAGFWAARRLTDYSRQRIADVYGRDESTVFHAVKRIEAKRARCPVFKAMTDHLLAECATMLAGE